MRGQVLIISERDLLTKSLDACLSIVLRDDATASGSPVVQLAGCVLQSAA